MRTYKLKAYSNVYTAKLVPQRYYNDNLAIAVDVECFDDNFYWTPFATLTVNLDSDTLPANMAYVDTNNCPWAEQFIKDNNIGEPTGEYGHSGYCDYPLYKFKEEL